MAVTVKVNGTSNSLVHKGSSGMARSTVPDVCKTPSPGGPVPIPYPIIVSRSSDLANGTTTVKADGGNSIGVKGVEFSRCSGDEAGSAGGVKSSTNMKEAKFILYSFDVKIEGKNACRLTDKMTMNHGNTFCLNGEDQSDVKPKEGDCIVGTYDEIKDKCPKGSQAHHIVPDYCARMGNRREGMAGRDRIPGMPSFGDGPSICLKGQARVSDTEHNLAHACDKKIAKEGAATGTAPASKVLTASKEAAIAARDDCKEQIEKVVDKQYGNVPGDKLMRTTQQPSDGSARAALAPSSTPTVGGVGM